MVYIIILLIIGCIGEYLYFTRKDGDSRRYNYTLRLENDALKRNAHSSLSNSSSIVIKYSAPPSAYASISSNTPLYLCPISTSPILSMSDTPTKVRVLCKAFIMEEVWYEVSLDVSTNINSRGWIKGNKVIFSETSSLSKI